MKTLIHRILYRTLPFEGYLRAVSRMFFVWQRLGIGRYAPATEYVYHLGRLVRRGDTCIDIGANLGYYARTISRLTGPEGRVYAVEPVEPIRRVLERNLRRCRNVEILPYALGTESRTVAMGNDSARETGYFGTGQNFVNDSGRQTDTAFTAEMRRGSELFARLERLDFIKCDIEGYELVVMREMQPLLERFRPRCSSRRAARTAPRSSGCSPVWDTQDTRSNTDAKCRSPKIQRKTSYSAMRIDIISSVPELMTSPLNESILKRAQEKGFVQIVVHNLHDYAHDRRKTTDDYPFGGEAGMVMKCEPVFELVEKLQSERTYDEIIYTSPDGIRYDQHETNRLSTLGNIIILCGHYKGIDHRIREHLITREISIGDYVLTGGELAACIIADSVVRLIPGAIGDEASALTDSFQDNLLAPPVYTRPAEFRGWRVPDVLLSGNFAQIEKWQDEQAWERTKRLRPDLLGEE